MFNQKGFSLIELLCVLSIVAILAGAAYPAYRGHVIHAKRTQAELSLMHAAETLERYFSSANSYENAVITEKSNDYRFVIISHTAEHFSVAAIAQGAQAKQDPSCSELILTDLNQHANSAHCWQ